MLSFLPPTPTDMMEILKTKFRKKRKALSYTQKELSTRADVSLGSVKRFESSGQISLESLLKLALVLKCLEEFGGICEEKVERFGSIEEVIYE